MESLEQADISTETGVACDSRGKPGRRQVTVVSATAWRHACRDLGREVPWTARRANLLVEGIDLPETTGGILRIGPVTLQINCEVDPCSRMDEQYPGLTRALQPAWRGGVGCTVLKGGSVALGDSVTLELPAV